MIPCYIGAIPVQLKAVLPGFTKGELGVLMPKGSEDLLEYVNELSYEKAAQIMQEGMGTQFDPNMYLVFLSCRSKLEQYYSLVQMEQQ